MPVLHWIGKEKVVTHHLDVPYKILEHKYGFSPDKGKHNEETESGNKIIHGDNLEALKSLLPEYEGKIKCIYIDPPYNTGNEKWVYNDNVNHPKIKKWLGEVVGKESDDFTRHDKWLCMMYPRLRILQKLLSEDGVIFISIDDNEQANLKLMMDEIFGKKNFVHTLIWKRKKQPSFLQKHIAGLTEYIIVFGKNTHQLGKFSIEKVSDDTRRLDNASNEISLRTFKKGTRVKLDTEVIKKGIYKIKSMKLEFLDDVVIKNGRALNDFRINAQFRTKQLDIDYFCTEDLVFITKNGGLRRLPTNEELTRKKTISNLLLEWGDNQDSEKEIQDIFHERKFDYSKPSKLIQNLINSITEKNSIILDSFSGSGTTAHAVLNLNKTDGGNRKFILIELEDYAETITAERVKRVINGYGTTEGTGGSFDFYELGMPIFKTDNNLNEMADEERIREYIYYVETKQKLVRKRKAEHFYLLDTYQDTGYYFYYEKEKITTLSLETLNIVTEKAEQYIIYADNCLLDKDYMVAKNIIFKKIPRDIKRF
jgi:adenine-specific DNA-methyltransferase